MAQATTADPNGIPNIIAKNMQQGKVAQVTDLAGLISDIQIETSLSEANILTLSLIDPALNLLCSGVFAFQPNGKLPIVDIELDGVWWRLSDVAGTTDMTQPNVVVEFQPRGVSLLRQKRGPKSATRGPKMTRAEFIHARTNEVKEFGGVPFYCPLISKVQPQQQGAPTGTKTVSGTSAASNGQRWQVTASAEVMGGTGAYGTPIQADGYSELSTNPGAPLGSLDFAALGNLPGGTELRITNPANGKSTTAKKQDKGAGSSFHPVMGLYPGTRSQLGLTGGEFTVIIERTDGKPLSPASGKKLSGSAGDSSTTTTTTDQPYQFQIAKGTNYWSGILALAQEVNWLLWWEGDTLFYMHANELAAATPIGTVNVVTGQMKSDVHVVTQNGKRVRKRSKTKSTYQDVVANFSFDTNNEQVTTEVTLDLVCDPLFIQAGDVLELTDPNGKSPWATAGKKGYQGRWIVTDCTRSLFNNYSELTLDIPGTDSLPNPSDEPAPQTTTSSSTTDAATAGGPKGSVAAAIAAAKQLSDMRIPYPSPDQHFSGSNAAAHPPDLDCSSSTSWVMYHAGMWNGGKDPIVSGEFATSWGAPGRGQEMTVWANGGHVFIEFHPKGGPHMQGNTSGGGGSGFRYFAWGANGEADANSGSFTPRHWPNT